MAKITTLDPIFWPLMQAPTVKLDRCAICGRIGPLNEHHLVWRSWGNLYRGGTLVKKPTITLCGFGNNLKDADGRMYCHGKAHHRMLHFRWVPHPEYANAGHLEYIEVDEPVKYQEALELDGWRPL